MTVAAGSFTDNSGIQSAVAGGPWPLGSSASLPAFATVELGDTSAIARATANGAIISQGTSPATVINAALAAASTDASGGGVFLGTGVYQIDTPIVGKNHSGLVSFSAFSRTGNAPVGGVLKSNGLGAGNAVVQSGGDGFFMTGVTVHANNQADYAFAHLQGADVNLHRCYFLYANQANVYHAPAAGGYAFVMADCETWGSKNYGVRVASGTDGRIINCGIFESANICASIAAGGWLLQGCHSTHSSKLTTTINTEITGSTCVVTGNYFDSCKNGPTLRLAGAGITVSANYILNQSSNNGGTLAVALDNAQGANITGNTTHTDKGVGMQWRSGTLPVSGCYGPNFHLGSAQGYVDPSGNPVPVQTTATLYVGPNPIS